MTEGAESGLRLTTGLIVTIISLTIMLALFGIFFTNAKTMQQKENELRQKENDSISSLIDYNANCNYTLV